MNLWNMTYSRWKIWTYEIWPTVDGNYESLFVFAAGQSPVLPRPGSEVERVLRGLSHTEGVLSQA